MIKILYGLLLAVLLVTPVSAGKPQNLDISSGTYFTQTSSWIEQQDDWPKPDVFIRNPFGGSCPWSVNDHSDWRAYGNLPIGAVTTRENCRVSDFNPVYATRYGYTAWWSNAVYGYSGLFIQAPSNKLEVSVCFSPQERCFVLGSVWNTDARAWEYEFCGNVGYSPNDSTLMDIEGSNGGRGVITTVTFSIKNPTDRIIKNIYVAGGNSSDVFFPAGCKNQRATIVDYPFHYFKT